MLLELDIQKLEKMICSFYEAMDVSISILDEDYSVLGSKKLNNPYCRLIQGNKRGLIKCMDSYYLLFEKCKQSKKPEMHICHAGLVEIALPIKYGDEVVGYLMLGHIKMNGSKENVAELISELPIDQAEALKIFGKLSGFEKEKIYAIIDMAEMFAEFILTEKLLRPKEDCVFDLVRQYIYDNYDKKINHESLSRGIHLSKTSLYNLIKKRTGSSVNEYINQVKIEKSKKLLLETNMSAEVIAEKLCFSSAAYYSRLFKKFVGTSPSVFRKHNS